MCVPLRAPLLPLTAREQFLAYKINRKLWIPLLMWKPKSPGSGSDLPFFFTSLLHFFFSLSGLTSSQAFITCPLPSFPYTCLVSFFPHLLFFLSLLLHLPPHLARILVPIGDFPLLCRVSLFFALRSWSFLTLHSLFTLSLSLFIFPPLAIYSTVILPVRVFFFPFFFFFWNFLFYSIISSFLSSPHTFTSIFFYSTSLPSKLY